MARKVYDKLLHWDEIKEQNWNALLLGNGFSVNISQGFNYKSLFELAKSEEIDFPLTDPAVNLFEGKDTTNFESILNLLLGAKLADVAITGGQKLKLKRLYKNIQKSLVSAVQGSHVRPDVVETEIISNEMSKFETVFTTNYDLIPYWSIMEHNTDKFRDYFWSEGTRFDENNTDIWIKGTRILYLHGALHILEELEGDNVWKNTANGLNLLDQFPKTFTDLSRPLFITEGSSKHKLSKIYSSSYLKFAYHELSNHNKSLVILGQSLDPEYDQHLIEAMSEWKQREIAISVWPGLSSEEIIELKARINRQLRMHSLSYFDSTSHPLGSVEICTE